jgi:phosphatidylglycerophosphatase A
LSTSLTIEGSFISKKFRLADPYQFLALGFGSGLAPKAPGTFGTLAAIPIYLLMTGLNSWLYLTITIIFSVVGIVICQKAADAAGVHDHPAIVWDEIVGFLITMTLVPLSLTNVVLGFILFRIFDIAKPWPISYLDKNLSGGLGIMLDDVVAGLMSMALLLAINVFLF